jgi:hypothetical protein
MGVIRDNRGWLVRRVMFTGAVLCAVFGMLLAAEGSSAQPQARSTSADLSYARVGSVAPSTNKSCDSSSARCNTAPTSGSTDTDCPPGTTLIAKFEVSGGGNYIFEKGQPGVVTIINGTVSGGQFSSTVLIKAVVIKASTDTKVIQFSPSTFSGSFDNSGMRTPQGKNTPDISNVRFCG